MRLTCPYCGERDRREFTYLGARELLTRPEGEWSEAWHAHLHLRENPPGEEEELWFHDPCSTALAIRRNRSTHEVIGTRLAGANP